MPWKKIDTEKFAKELGIDIETIKAKHELIDKIKKARAKQGLTQQDLASKMRRSQSWIAKIESGVGTRNVSFELLFQILAVLGYRCKISTRKVSDPETMAA